MSTSITQLWSLLLLLILFLCNLVYSHSTLNSFPPTPSHAKPLPPHVYKPPRLLLPPPPRCKPHKHQPPPPPSPPAWFYFYSPPPPSTPTYPPKIPPPPPRHRVF
ncbi:hypothetical protein O6P43_018846 [Quillaja saponaria]|uniref:Uncharacterized protein n=1 Tax=Quillaja saponaria TaxID=32244 RepID=A0AAD7LIP9_QUISA|nr:hypothetical protein O6P43_018846 [Quillaja saponaria]